ncbi:MAG: alpha/beta fold hydrolase [Burkholderiales bacterium]
MSYRQQWLSKGIEDLLAALEHSAHQKVDFEVVVVGSGYGGAVAAARLARAQANGKPLRVCVLERGQEYLPGAFPRGISNLPGSVRFSRYDDAKAKGPADGLFDFRLGSDLSALVGNGLGGTSLINASVAERPNADVFEDPAWPAELRRDLDALDDCYYRAECMLGVTDANVDGISKYRELGEFAKVVGATARPARIAVYDGSRPNRQGVTQKPCVKVGNCVLGCNNAAKNTLAMNYLPEAKRFGAALYTNATVSHVEKVEELVAGRIEVSWRVHYRQTAVRHPPAGGADFPLRPVRARHVVLAAGTFGSTEILMRSRARGLRVSAQLGRHFSGNGDMISVLYKQKNPVNAAPGQPNHTVGPTITGIVETGATRADRVMVEELGIPVSLRRIFEELVTSGALPVTLTKFDWSRHDSAADDAAAVDADAIDRSQIFAAMGDDRARGRLEMVEGWAAAGADGAIRVDWKDAGTEPIYARQDALLARSAALCGTYLRNPLWRPLPEALDGMLSASQPGGKLLSVHPLGGCPMGDDSTSGVVDDLGRVYDPSDPKNHTHTHAGLLVLDGSIIPAALGINPLLTITALAERAIERYARTCGWTIDFNAPFRCALPVQPTLPPHADAPGAPAPAAPTESTAVRFAERMTGPLDLAPGSTTLTDVELEVEFDAITNVPAFLRSGPHQLTLRNATLSLPGGTPARVSGSVYWMERGRTGWLCRVARALLTYLRTRALADLAQRRREAGLLAALKSLLQPGAFLAFASNLGEVRYLRYEMRLEDKLMQGADEILPAGTALRGLKTLRYVTDGNPWRQLSQLQVKVTRPGGKPHSAGTLQLDPLYLLRRFAAQLQIISQADQPNAIIDVASIALFVARIVLKVHFWSFRLPEYEKQDPERERRRMPGALDGLQMDRHFVPVATATAATGLVLPLTRYRRQADGDRLPVLLIHGFGSGGIQFAHPDLTRNLVRHLAEKGFDVWVAELRTSIAVPSSFNQWTLDEVAKEDIPAIVRCVLEATGKQQLDVVAHCIGSAMFCTAVLDGRLTQARGAAPDDRHPLVRSAVLLQVGPLITLSQANRFRAHVAAALRRFMLADFMYSAVDSSADWQDALLDRALSTYPYPESEWPWHRLWPPCKPHTHIANCNRSAGIFGRLFQHHNVDDAMLDALGDLLGHVNLRTFEQTMQYAFLGRLTDHDGCNRYVTDDNVAAHFRFPVLFLHGAENDVFHPETTRRSLQLLQDIFGRGPARDRIVIPGYGHLDPLIGRTAEQCVYRHISAFLRSADGLPPGVPLQQRRARFPLRPIIGPLLGWTRRHKDASGVWRWTARIWCRTDDEHSYAYFIIAVVLDAQGQPVPGHTFRGNLSRPQNADAVPAPGQLLRAVCADVPDLLAVVDVTLPERDDDFEILIVGAHASVDPETQDAGSSTAAEELMQQPEPAGVQAREQSDARFPAADPLPDAYGKAMVEQRAIWMDKVKAGRDARRACDRGYDERPDSVRLSRDLLKRLDPGSTGLDFALGSCRYSATMIDRERADATFGRLRDLVERRQEDAPAPSLLLLAGDQIYADATAGLFDPKDRRSRFYDAYREVWTAPNAREVLRQLPTYMMLDDHEVSDDWHPQDPDDGMRAWALRAFEEYQLAHSPNAFASQRLSAAAPSDYKHYYYDFSAGGFAFFVCDTRTERTGRIRIMQSPQFGELTNWLKDQEREGGSRPKFVLSPSVVLPFLNATRGSTAYAARSDGWDGFADSLRELFGFIARESIRNVVFLCGDPHFSMSSEIQFGGANLAQLRALCIVASPMYAPYPFANARPADFLGDNAGQPLQLGCGATMHYCRESIVVGDSFTLVGVKPKNDSGWRVCASVYRGQGAPVQTCFDLP